MPINPFAPGTPAPAAAPPSTYADRAAYLHPRTRDYVLDDESEFARMPIVRQQMLLALTTRKGSCSVDPGAGIELPQKIGPNIDQDMRAAVERACAHITAAGRARITDVKTTPHMLGVKTVVSYQDLTIGVNDAVIF